VSTAAHQLEAYRQEPIRSFEVRLIDLLGNADCLTFQHGNIRIGIVRQGSFGDVTVNLVAQDMRDFCILDTFGDGELREFADFLLGALEEFDAARLRIGPISESTSKTLESLLQQPKSNFIFRDTVLSVEPLLDKGRKDGQALASSLRRALGDVRKAGFTVSSDSYSASAMAELHAERWGHNRSPQFFQALHVFAKEPYCDCISLKDQAGNLLGQQLDFCFFDKRYFYYAIAEHGKYPGIGKALLSESVRRFFADPNMTVYSFGRGGEKYKYRYANCVRLNRYVLGFRTDHREELK
jgi:hypothetical protein